ncbi:HypC/HybG/HupF family hydrogenase formation chaperone [Methylacidiphilum kamchatkense]|uniref:Hydrogenase expression/formation protein HypC n=1 Tax=Methylacidiphilum kamchatkense Kam1 TaxID=1202785 RepID=A0A516TLH5_9BACT|nr:HypC/HybG/HupF family hydrogenase formation chaperone [Methylacidiphilum kamchatkense]QDQ42076.1 hydrogenase expression/formation protein HypC [Methylacidiphilum kamchatkense Kam1]
MKPLPLLKLLLGIDINGKKNSLQKDMCLAIPGKIVEMDPNDQTPFVQTALVEVSSVRRRINIELIKDEELKPGDWVLIHVGFALAKISEREAQDQLRILSMLGEDKQAMEELQGYSMEEEKKNIKDTILKNLI